MSRVSQLVLILSSAVCLSMTGCVRTTLVCQAAGQCPPSVYDPSDNDIVAREGVVPILYYFVTHSGPFADCGECEECDECTESRTMTYVETRPPAGFGYSIPPNGSQPIPDSLHGVERAPGTPVPPIPAAPPAEDDDSVTSTSSSSAYPSFFSSLRRRSGARTNRVKAQVAMLKGKPLPVVHENPQPVQVRTSVSPVRRNTVTLDPIDAYEIQTNLPARSEVPGTGRSFSESVPRPSRTFSPAEPRTVIPRQEIPRQEIPRQEIRSREIPLSSASRRIEIERTDVVPARPRIETSQPARPAPIVLKPRRSSRTSVTVLNEKSPWGHSGSPASNFGSRR